MIILRSLKLNQKQHSLHSKIRALQYILNPDNSTFGANSLKQKPVIWLSKRLKSDLTHSEKQHQVSTKREKVKQATKDASYSAVIIAGVIATGGILLVLFRELLSKSGPTKIFGDALEECRNNQEICVALGTPIEGYGEMTSRKRRRHVSHLAYIDNQGRDAMRMKFYIKGSSGRTGTVDLDAVIKNRTIKYRYILANIDIYPPRKIIVKDQRSEIDLYCDEEKTLNI